MYKQYNYPFKWQTYPSPAMMSQTDTPYAMFGCETACYQKGASDECFNACNAGYTNNSCNQ